MANDLRNRTRKLKAEILEDRHMLTVVTWDGGGGDFNWHNAANWNDSGVDRLPGPNDDVLIENVSANIVIDHVDAITLGSLELKRSGIRSTGSAELVVEDFLWLENASIAASGGSQFAIDTPAWIQVVSDLSITSDGADSLISITGLDFLTAGTVTASDGGQVSMPNLTDTSSPATFNVSGGSRLSLGTTEATTVVRGEVVLDDSEVFSSVIEIAQLSGNGTIHGDLVVRDEVRPVGTLNVTGDLRSWLSLRTIVIGLSGPDDFAKINVGGAAAMDTIELQVELLDGYVPSLGDTYDFLNAQTLTGNFIVPEPTGTGVTYTINVSDGTATATAISDLGPRVNNISVNGLIESLNVITVNLTKSIAADTVSKSAVTLEDSSGPLTDFAVTYASFRPTQFRIELDAPAPADTYRLRIDPVITDVDGNLLDQDGDGTLGESDEDAYFAEFVVTDDDGPRIRIAEESFARGPIAELLIRFDSPIVVSSFTPEDIVVIDKNGQPVDVQPLIEPRTRFASAYNITFQNPITSEGEYDVRIGPDILDVNGHAMDQNDDGVFGDPLLDAFVWPLEVKVADPIPTVLGNGVFTELFFNIEENFDVRVTKSPLSGRSPDETAIVPAIDFPNTAEWVSTRDGATFSEFFSDTFPLTEEQAGEVAGTFMLRNTFYLAVNADADLNPDTPEIDIRTGIGSDDGYILTIDTDYVSHSPDRSWRYTWDGLAFPTPGIYPVELIYSANDRGESGLEFAWETATSGGEQIVPTEFLYFDNSPLFAGDADLNGSVNSTDLGLLLNNFNDDSGLGWQSGNFNDDLFVDSTDLGLLLNNFNSNGDSAAVLATAAFAAMDKDVNRDGSISPIDALSVINYLNDRRELTASEFAALDVDGNGSVVPRDALMVINRLNEVSSSEKVESDPLQIQFAFNLEFEEDD